MIYILFGEMGIGKNYVGEKLAEYLGCEFFDGDDVVPKHMAEKVANFKPLSLSDLDDYIQNYLIGAIQMKAADGKDLVVAQALYRREHREALLEAFRMLEVLMVYLPAPSFRTHMRRLLKREDGWKWVLWSLFNKPFFQKPPFLWGRILWNDGRDLLPQFEDLEKPAKVDFLW